MTIQQAVETAMNLHRAGRLAEAEGIYRQILAQHPNHPDALHLLGLIAYQAGRCQEAEALIRRAIVAAPNNAAFHSNLGVALHGQGKSDEAIAVYRRAIEIQPDFVDVYRNLGNAFKAQGRLDETIATYTQSLQLQPLDPEVLNNLGYALHDQGRFDEALAAYAKAIQLRPAFAEVHYNIGNVFKSRRQLDEAAAAYSRALQLNPNYPEAHNNLGTILQDQEKTDEALAAYRRAIALKPELGNAQLNLALLLLLTGDFEKGLREFENRWHAREFSLECRDFIEPRWNGEALNGTTILLHAEQGAGDTIQFVRYAARVAARSGRVILECSPDVARLLHGVAGIETIVTAHPLPRFDVHCPLLSLPFIFETRLETIPGEVPYIQADPDLAKTWREKLGRSHKRLKVGLAWAGNPKHKADARRSIAFSQLALLADIHDITFYSLQKGPAAVQAQERPEGMELIDLTAELHDFADTAALIENLDLVISVDTAVAHLAGAMGKPVWLLISPRLDWRWFIDREDSPWYPTMRLFRQKPDGDWTGVIARVVKALQEFGIPGVPARRLSL